MTQQSSSRRVAVNKIRLTLLVTTLFTLLALTVYRSSSLLFMVALLLSTVIFTALLGRRAGRALQLQRSIPSQVNAGDTATIRVELCNRGGAPILLAKLHLDNPTCNNDTVPPAFLQFGSEDYETPLLRSQECAVWRQRWKFTRRGVVVWPRAEVGATDPLGISDHLIPQGDKVQTLVLPRVVSINHLGFLGGSSSGMQRAPMATSSTDAADLHGIRRWHPGEAVRRIHWKSTARTGQLHIIEWEDYPAGDVCVLLDTQQSVVAGDEAENTLEAGINLVASMAAYVLESGYRFTLICWQETAGQRELILNEGRGPATLQGMLQTLARLQTTAISDATLNSLVNEAARHQNVDAVVLITSSLSSWQDAHRGLQSRHDTASAAFVLDADSFSALTSQQMVAPQQSQFSQTNVRFVQRGEPVEAVLEQPF
jgi:uncharacterized protein (DUF58 family)